MLYALYSTIISSLNGCKKVIDALRTSMCLLHVRYCLHEEYSMVNYYC